MYIIIYLLLFNDALCNPYYLIAFDRFSSFLVASNQRLGVTGCNIRNGKKEKKEICIKNVKYNYKKKQRRGITTNILTKGDNITYW